MRHHARSGGMKLSRVTTAACIALLAGAACSGANQASTASSVRAGASPFTSVAHPAASPQVSDSGGVIEGSVGYPADVNPSYLVYAITTDGSRYFRTEKAGYGVPATAPADERSAYRIVGVAPGDYFVVALPLIQTPYFWQTASDARTGTLRFG